MAARFSSITNTPPSFTATKVGRKTSETPGPAISGFRRRTQKTLLEAESGEAPENELCECMPLSSFLLMSAASSVPRPSSQLMKGIEAWPSGSRNVKV